MGIALVRMGRPEEAIEQYRRVLYQEPDFAETWANLAMAYATMGESARAVASGQKAFEQAKSQGRTALARQIEDWLNSYRAKTSDITNVPPVPKSADVPP